VEPMRFTGGSFALRVDNNWYINAENIGVNESIIEFSEWAIRNRDRGEGQTDLT